MQQDWNPALYLRYKNERAQPAIDLVNKININDTPKSILDVGCGPGNSAQVLLQRWGESNLVGIDSSPNMIDEAKSNYPQQTWVLTDAFKFNSSLKFNLIFSNAAMQWMPDHEKLINKFYTMLDTHGILAAQIPEFDDKMPIRKKMAMVANKWQTQAEERTNTHSVYEYFDILSACFSHVDIWQTTYLHILSSQAAIIDFFRSTGMRPYLNCLNSLAEKQAFEQDVLAAIKDDYPIQQNGQVLLPMARLFFIGYK